MTNAATNTHIQALLDLRALNVDHRRRLVSDLVKPNERGGAQDVREVFITLQRTIEAIDSALKDEVAQAKQ